MTSPKDKRPRNLDLTTIAFPITAIISILHRVSGVAIFLSLPFLLSWLSQSLQSPFDFYHLQANFHDFFCMKLIAFFILAAVVFHVIAGFRHLLMDMGIGETLVGGLWSARCVLIVSTLIIVLMGYWLWQ
jgi:succinate dehydrogenase / fumarate reductase cytochrome b subunit